MSTVAIITASGIGSRMNLSIPKQFLHIDDKPLIIYTLEVFQSHPLIDAIVVPCLEGWENVLHTYALQYGITKLKHIIKGGASGQESIHNALCAVRDNYSEDTSVVVHDGNRGLVTHEVISEAIATYLRYGSAVAAIPCIEAVFRSEDASTATQEIPREQLFRTQTPHVYSLEKMLWAHDQAAKKGLTETTATCSLMAALGETVHFSKGSERNFKVTTREDLDIFKAFLRVEK